MGRRIRSAEIQSAASPLTQRAQPSLRLAWLYSELAAVGPDGLTRQELLARPSIRALYSVGSGAASQALRRDLILLTGAPERRLRQQAGAAQPAPLPPEVHPPLVEYIPKTQRYVLSQATGPLRLSPEALEALCILAGALRGGKTLPGGADLFAQLQDALVSDQQAALVQALQGQAHDQAAPALHLDLPDLEEESLDTLRRLTRAIRRRQTIDFDYQRRPTSPPTPHRGDEALEIWIGAHIYVGVWCEEARRELDLRLDRFVPGSISQHPRSATRRQRRGERIRYWLAPEIAQGGVSARLEKQEVQHQADGSAIVSGISRSRFWAKKLLLAYGSNARALSPPPLVEEMRRTAEEMLRLYEDNGRQWEIEEK
jgi:predicted DNA-binding transcriptional regulator YafY